jgi:tetratricopeptide (TPR) repeat protein
MICGDNDVMMTRKYKADLLYYKSQYEDALKIYKNILINLPTSHQGQVKREIMDSISLCLLKLKSSDAIRNIKDCLQFNNEEDSTWNQLAIHHRQADNIFDEVIAVQQCCKIKRHCSFYWSKLADSYGRLSEHLQSAPDVIISDALQKILDDTVTLFKPYITDTTHLTDVKMDQYHSFIYYISNGTFCKETVKDFFYVASCFCLLWSKQLLLYSCSHSSSFALISNNESLGNVSLNLSSNYPKDLVGHLYDVMIKAVTLDL